MTPIERAARALREEAATFTNPVACYVEGETQYRWQAANPGLDYWSEGPGSAYADPDDIASWSILARAVLQAIREPSEGMNVSGSSYTSSDYEDAADCWRAMIERALSE